MKTYFIKCRNDIENIDPEIEQKITISYAIKIFKRTRSKKFIK